MVIINKMNLISFLKKNENARKIFGEREIKIIEKQIFGISLTQSEKNRLSRDIRKKFEFIKEISAHSFDFKLKKSSEIKEIINEAREILFESPYFPRIIRVYLFGSTVENQRTFRSDVDIAVEFKEISERDATLFRIKTHLPEKIDLQVFNVLPEKIKKEILNKGKIIYERKN